MPKSLREICAPLNWFALAPLLVSAAAWLKEVSWFKSPSASTAVGLVLLMLALGVAILVVVGLVYAQVSSAWALLFSAFLLSTAVLLFTRQGVIALVKFGYNQELHAYTSLIAVAASKRGHLLVHCAASCPLLLAAITLYRRYRSTRSSGHAESAA